ncbi:alpha/beta fold hydrolase [Paraburkholderia oxyphila]|uniref:alpha/beta fold hydrolase n=1 Tax=Paraburkholderia oxyphila TaxID=614212 RepID=UPI00069405F2|nr:alpha/beta hydrolase [Paraburkholderia oxyphila]
MQGRRAIHANEIELYYEAFGSRTDPALLLVMGNSAPGLVWPDEFCAMLAATSLYVIRFDARDTGLSTYIDFDETPYTLDDLVEDAFALLDGIGLSKAHIVGLSQGGVIGYRMAIRRPQRLLSLTVMMSSADLRPKNDAFAGAAAREGELPRPSPNYVAKVVALNATAPTTIEEVARRFVENFRLAAGPRSPFDEAAWQALGHAFAQLPLSRNDGLGPALANNSNHALAQKLTSALTVEELSAIRVPVLLIQGSDDPIFPVEHARWSASVIPGAKLHIIDAMGHALDPAFFNSIVGTLNDFYG